MADILDELYEDFATAVYVITEELRRTDSFLSVGFDLDEEMADGICSVVSQHLAIGVRVKSGQILRIGAPVVLSYETEMPGVWYFFIERENETL